MSFAAVITSAILSALVVSLAGAALLTGHCSFDQFLEIAAPFAGGTAVLHVTRTSA